MGNRQVQPHLTLLVISQDWGNSYEQVGVRLDIQRLIQANLPTVEMCPQSKLFHAVPLQVLYEELRVTFGDETPLKPCTSSTSALRQLSGRFGF